MNKLYKRYLLFLYLIFHAISVNAQLFTCDGTFYITRYASGGDSTYLGTVDFIPNDINISNRGILNPRRLYNGSVQYAGYIWTQDYDRAASPTFELALRRFDQSLNSTLFTISNSVPTPGSFSTRFNNAGVDKFGTMYLLDFDVPAGAPALGAKLYAIDLSTGTPTLKPGFPKQTLGLDAGNPVIWGDITVDPTTNRVYTWYHPTAASTNLIGLYEITNISSANPTLVKVGGQALSTVGSMFFNERGQLFGYGSVGVGNAQDRLYAINKTTGALTQYGLPDSTVSGSDGCECVFRLTLDRSVSTSAINIQKCKRDTFSYNFGLRNTTALTLNNVTVEDTLDTRFNYLVSAATLQAELNTTMGPGVVVTISSHGGGTNNTLRVTGLNVPPGLINFKTDVLIDATNLTSSFFISEQAFIKNVDPIYGGPVERSNDPSTYNDKDPTAFSVNLLGSACLTPVSNNFVNHPIPQGAGLTRIPNLASFDPDGIVTSYTITTVPPASEGLLYYCTSGDYPCSGSITQINNGQNLTPAQMLQLYFDPTGNFLGSSKFYYTGYDNLNQVSNSAVYTLPVTKQAPVANNTFANAIVNSGGSILVNPITWGDADGTIQTVHVKSIPNPAASNLMAPCPTTFTNAICNAGFQALNAAVLGAYPTGIPLSTSQAQALRISPMPAYTGLASYQFTVTDNIGNESSLANYSVPVVSSVTFDRPPLSNNIRTQHINNSLSATAIPRLMASDIDGAVASYRITSVPNAAAGRFFVSCGAVPTGATCTGGFFEVNNAVLAANAGSISLTPTQIQSMTFDPSPSFVGNTSFQFQAIDNEGLVGNSASYTIEVINEQPKALNIKVAAIFNSPFTGIVPPTGSDFDGTISELRIKSVPSTTQGVFRVPCTVAHTGGVCSGGYEEITPSILTNYPSGIPLTVAQSAGMQFRPATGFSGVSDFDYTSIDNNSIESEPGSYRVIIANQPPNSRDSVNQVVVNTDPRANLTSKLLASDADGTVNSFKIFTIPLPVSGTLFVPCGGAMATPNGATCTGGFAAINAAVLAVNPGGVVIDTNQSKLLAFDPGLYYTGVVNFTYAGTDNSGNTSNVSVYSIPISGVGNLPPVSLNVVAPTLLATNSSVVIPNLSGLDGDGSIVSYSVTNISPSYKGVLSVACGTGANPTPPFTTCTGGFANLTVAALNSNGGALPLSTSQSNGLRFDPDQNYTGNFTFSYAATDDDGSVSYTSSYSIPITGTVPNASPIVVAPIDILAGPTAVPPFVASDADGTIVEYLIDYLPPTFKGTFSVPCPPNLAGAGPCTGGYQNLNPTMLNTYFDGIPLTPTQISGLRFDPFGSFEGGVIINYHAKDNSGLISNTAAYNIYIKGVNPFSNDVNGPKLFHNLGPTAIAPLHGADDDGSVPTFFIHSLPLANQGVLSIPCPNTPIGATCSGGYANLTAAVLAANPNGIQLTPTQNAGLRFDPALGYDGDVIFNFSSMDNLNNLSNVATYVLHVGRFAVLPTKLIDFTAVREGENIQTKWNVENEKDVAFYEIQISTNNQQYTSIKQVLSTNLGSNIYNQKLLNFTNSIYYVRLKIVALNGDVTYSKVAVVLNNDPKSAFLVWPNPFIDQVFVRIPAGASEKYSLQIMDAKGAVIYRRTIMSGAAATVVTIQKEELAKVNPSQMYFVRLSTDNSKTVFTTKLFSKK